MNTKRVITTIGVFLTLAGATSVNASTAAAEPELPPCQTNPARSAVVQEYSEGSWGYLYRVIWCVEEERITWAVPDVVPILPDDSDCAWKGTLDNSLRPMPDSEDWLGFDMGWFSCPAEDGSTDDFPWGIVHIRPDGTSEIQDQGTA